MSILVFPSPGSNHDSSSNENVIKQKVKPAQQWLYTCVINLCRVFLSRPQQSNNVEWPSFA